MKFFINTEDFSSKFVVSDGEGLDRYFVKNEMDSVMRKLTIYDLADNVVCTVGKKFFTLRPTYVIFNKHNQLVLHIRKKLNLLHPQFTITCELDDVIKFHTKGNYFGSDFSITSKDEQETIAKITRNNGYIVEILDDEHDASALIAVVIIIHLYKRNTHMTFSEAANNNARERVQWILDNQCKIPVRPTTSISFYYKTSNGLIDEADYHYKNNQLEQSFILYSRYITLFIEELKLRHPAYATVSVYDRESVKEIIRSKAFPRAEELKAKLKEKYAIEFEMKQKIIQDEEDAKISAAASSIPSNNFHNENEQRLNQLKANHVQIPPTHVALFALPPVNNGLVQTTKEIAKPSYDRSQKPLSSSTNFAMGSLRRIAVPNDITTKFLQVAQRNTDRKIETCGILAGSRVNNQYVLTHIVVPKQNGGPDSCDTEKEEEMVEYVANNDLITLGWIHTHPTQTVFLSSVDLHTHLPYQMLMQEAIAIVISPKYNETAIYSLTPDTGIPVLSTCKKTGFHEHVNNPPLFVTASHANYDPGLQCKIVDLRN